MSDATRSVHSRKRRGGAASSQTYSAMSEIYGKHRNIYVDYLMGESKTCLIHLAGHLSYECKVLGDFGSSYSKAIPTKDRGHNPVLRNKFNRQQENNAIFNSAVDEILLHKNEKLSAMKESNKNIKSYFDENKLYHIDNMSLENKTEKLE